jgi:hypothetical protein
MVTTLASQRLELARAIEAAERIMLQNSNNPVLFREARDAREAARTELERLGFLEQLEAELEAEEALRSRW